jgi:hypothetical protein
MRARFVKKVRDGADRDRVSGSVAADLAQRQLLRARTRGERAALRCDDQRIVARPDEGARKVEELLLSPPPFFARVEMKDA